MNDTIIRVTYIDATPVHEHLRNLRNAGATFYRVALLAELSPSYLHGIATRQTKRIRSDIAAAILHVTIETATAPKQQPTPALDPHTLTAILAGEPAPIATKDKPAYVRALTQKGWGKYRISMTLGISGGDINNALTEAAA